MTGSGSDEHNIGVMLSAQTLSLFDVNQKSLAPKLTEKMNLS